jgi:CTP:molybdopterin cytidylyltransferase MocA
MAASIKLFGLILAAGSSSRMGFPKAHLTVGGLPVAIHQARTLTEVCESVLVVAGWNAAGLQRHASERVKVIASPHWWREEPLESVRRGLNALPDGDVLILPVDAPAPTLTTLTRIARTAGTAVPVYENERGHPIKLAHELRERVLFEPSTTGLRKFLTDACSVEVEEAGVLLNLNKPANWARWIRFRSTA